MDAAPFVLLRYEPLHGMMTDVGALRDYRRAVGGRTRETIRRAGVVRGMLGFPGV